MVTIRRLSDAEAQQANKHALAAYWSIPLALGVGLLIIASLLSWLFDAPWEIAWWCIGGLFAMAIMVKLTVGKRSAIIAGIPIVERRGKVVQTATLNNRPLSKVNIGQCVSVTLTPVVLPEPYPQRDRFEVWRTVGMPYFEQDETLPRSHQQLVGREVLITYLPETGYVLSFDPLNTDGNPLVRQERAAINGGVVTVTRDNGHQEQIGLDDVDDIVIYSHSKIKPNDRFFLVLRSSKTADVSSSSGAAGFPALEEELARALEGFDANHYDIIKWDVWQNPTVVWKRPLAVDARIVHTLSPGDLDGIQQGIYLENLGVRLSWGSFGELDDMHQVERRGSAHPNRLYRGYEFVFLQPTLFGIQVRELLTETPSWHKNSQLNPRWPVTTYRTVISLGGGGRADLATLAAHFRAALGTPDEQADPLHDGDASLWVKWVVANVTIELTIWKPYQSDDYRPGCRLQISREPDLTEFYETDYTENLKLHDQLCYTILEGVLEIPSNYTQYPYVNYLPDVLKAVLPSEEHYVVWRDDYEGVVGFGNCRFAHIVTVEGLDGLQFVGEYWRTAPSGLAIYLQRGKDSTKVTAPANFIGRLETKDSDQFWPAVQQHMGSCLQLPVGYREDRQYH